MDSNRMYMSKRRDCRARYSLSWLRNSIPPRNRPQHIRTSQPTGIRPNACLAIDNSQPAAVLLRKLGQFA
jgi:hypothetical protein